MAIPVVEPERYAEQLAAKRDRLVEQFARFSPPELEVYPSEHKYSKTLMKL